MNQEISIPYRFRVQGTNQVLEVFLRRIIIAGFTGRDRATVEAHMRELAELGVVVPEEVPIAVKLDPSLLTQGDQIDVWGSFTSGEVEPVVLYCEGKRWLTVGSDHTDRDLERRSIEQAKAGAPKVVGREIMELDSIADLDAIELASWVDDERSLYQRGFVGDILPIDAIESVLSRLGLTPGEGDILFCGSIPVLGPLRPARRFAAELRDPGSGRVLSLGYSLRISPPVDRLGQKPEIEFTAVGRFPWSPVDPTVSGLTERILARYGDTTIATRMLRFAPGTDTSPMGTLTHDFWEEVYILEGAITDLVLGTTYSAGSYACRPPGMRHGPWVAPEGCTTFEVRYLGPT